VSEHAPPASAATEGRAEGAAPKTRRHRVQWPAWLPKTVVFTAALTLLTAWLFPALSRQWQDRQKARELKASLITQIGKNTSEALITSSFLTGNRFPSSRDPARRGWNQEVFNRLDLNWRTSSAEVEAQLRAYFPERVAARWVAYSDLVWGTYRLVSDNKSARPRTIRRLRSEIGDRVEATQLDALEVRWIDEAGNPVGNPDRARPAYFYVSIALLKRRSVVIDEILHSHPAEFNTRPADLARDLLPFL